MPHIFSFFEHWFGAFEPVAGAVLVSLLLFLFAVKAKSALAKVDDPRIPDQSLTIRNTAELIVGTLRDFVMDTMGHDGKKFIPFFGTMFVFIFANNLLGVIPGFNPPTSNINPNAGIAIIVFLLTHYLGLKAHGMSYLKHFMGPVAALAFLMIPIELVSHLVRPVSLSLRLYGNMTGDHAVLSIFTDLTKIGIPVIFLCVGIFISFVQAMVFTMLSMVYIGGAIAHDEH